jgi:lipoprotein-anchoring transpeptidase ErfK/SrfK
VSKLPSLRSIVALVFVVVSLHSPAAEATRARTSAPAADGAWTARLVAPTRVTTAPAGEKLETLQPQTGATGSSATLLVLGTAKRHGEMWLRVRLPQRPNTASGWIRSDDAVLTRTSYRISISTSRRLLTLYRDGRVTLRTRVVVGAPATPTPNGLFALYDIVPVPGSALAPYELQLTAHSDALRTFNGGEGRVALHGMNGPLRVPLGTARSHGCVRLLPATTSLLARVVPLGSPVAISP